MSSIQNSEEEYDSCSGCSEECKDCGSECGMSDCQGCESSYYESSQYDSDESLSSSNKE